MRIFGRILMNAADKGGAGGAPVDPNTALLAALAALTAKFDELPRAMEAAANKAVHGAFAKQKKEPPKEVKGEDDADDDEGDADPAVAGKVTKPASGAAGGESPEAKALRKLQRKLDAMESEGKAKDAQAKARKLSAERAEDRAKLVATLTGKVKPELLDAAVALHFDGKGRVRRERENDDEDGKPLWFDGDDSMTIEEGVAKWISSPEGKAYVPPVAAGGSGNRGGGRVDDKGHRVATDADIGAFITGGAKTG